MLAMLREPWSNLLHLMKNRTLINILLAGLLLACCGPNVRATENWEWSGFASFGGGQINRDQLKFIDFDDDWSFNSDSVAGLHTQGDITEHWSLTAQVIAQGHHWDDTGDFHPELDWLFLSHALSPGLRLRLGRMRSPHYLFSETLDVGYSYPWVRPPVEVYTFFMSPFSNFDGMDLTWNTELGDADLDIQALAGTMDGEFLGLDIEVEPVAGANVTLRQGEWLLRYGVLLHRTDLTNAGSQAAADAFNQLAAIDPQFEEVANSFEADNAWYQYHALGGQWDHGNWTLLGEAFEVIGPDEGFSTNASGWYLSWQYHFARLAPYITTGHYKNTLNEDQIQLLEDSFITYPPGSLGPAVDALRYGTIDAFRNFYSEQYSWTLGVRYELLANTSLKCEVQYFDFIGGSTGHMIPEPGAPRPDDALLTSFIVDVVF